MTNVVLAHPEGRLSTLPQRSPVMHKRSELLTLTARKLMPARQYGSFGRRIAPVIMTVIHQLSFVILMGDLESRSIN